MRSLLLLAPLLAVGAAWLDSARKPPSGPPPTDMDALARQYVQLVLALGVHDASYVDAYYGPPEWKVEAEARKLDLAGIKAEAAQLRAAVLAQPVPKDELGALRRTYLARQLEALVTRCEMLAGRKLGFDEESQALYDAVSPAISEDEFKQSLGELERALPGSGPVSERYEAFRKRFLIPNAKLDVVFRAAIDECRRRTLPHVNLPKGESFVVEYVTGKPWSGYNWYKGGYHSVIQVNTDLPTSIDRAVDLACHEGYPGHHVYNALLEQHLVRERGFQEFTVYPLFSPQSLIAEGTANYGIEVAFPAVERLEFEKRVLFPLAGLDASQAEAYYAAQHRVERLGYAGTEAARRYLEGRMTADEAARWLETYTLASSARARQRLSFFDAYRSYVINYTLGLDLVRAYIERRGGTADQPEKRWSEFTALLASPRLPAGLR